MNALSKGDPAPRINAVEAGGSGTFDLASLTGQIVVVYFYPKDDTPGCTAEAKSFSCLKDRFDAAGAVVVGISPDTPRSHQRFRDKHDLDVRLVSDETHGIAEAYGVWVEKTMYGRTFMGVERATFLIGCDGRIAHIWRNVKVADHAEDVLARLLAL